MPVSVDISKSWSLCMMFSSKSSELYWRICVCVVWEGSRCAILCYAYEHVHPLFHRLAPQLTYVILFLPGIRIFWSFMDLFSWMYSKKWWSSSRKTSPTWRMTTKVSWCTSFKYLLFFYGTMFCCDGDERWIYRSIDVLVESVWAMMQLSLWVTKQSSGVGVGVWWIYPFAT